MAVASIVCVDGDLDVHDTASAAVAAAIERRREVTIARIGICVGDIELGDPLGLAKRLCTIAPTGAILVSDTIRRSVERDQRAFVDLGAISTTGYRDRIHVFELDGVRTRDRTVLSIGLAPHGRIAYRGHEEEEHAQYDAQLSHYDRMIWGVAFAHRGFIDRALGDDHLIVFADSGDALRAAIAIDAALQQHHQGLGNLQFGLERATMTYMADRWWSPAWRTAERIRSHRFRRIAASTSLLDGVGAATLRELGLVIEVVEEVVQKGIRDPVRVAQLQMA